MTTALTPALALDYVRELSADVIAGVVLDAEGDLLAGPEALAEPARALLAAAPEASELHGTTGGGGAYAARDERHAIVVATGRFALTRVTLHDLRTALAALGGGSAGIRRAEAVPLAAVEVLLAAAQDPFRRHRAI
jgi:hypothetical protein